MAEPLDIYYEIRVTLEGEKPQSDEKKRLREIRAERYAMQAVARHLMPSERVSICLRNRRSKDVDIEVWKHLMTHKAFYAGLMVCGSVWMCPVCAAKISERRRNELREAFDRHLAAGGYCSMLTLTFRHTKKDKLKPMLERLTKALRRFRTGKRYAKIRDKLGLIGSIRAFEITYGKNGFHPHVHLLLFHEKEVEGADREILRHEMFDLWETACKANDLDTILRCISLQDAKEASTYITKWGEEKPHRWGIDREMTKAHIKKGREEGLTPFDFLRIILDTGDAEYVELFQEYADAMKGIRQLLWSPGLKKKYLIEEKTDEQLSEEKTEMADLLGIIPYYQWQKILKSDKRVEFLELCEQEDFDRALQTVLKEKNVSSVSEGNQIKDM